MDPQSYEVVLGVMEVWVGSEQTLKHLEDKVQPFKVIVTKLAFCSMTRSSAHMLAAVRVCWVSLRTLEISLRLKR